MLTSIIFFVFSLPFFVFGCGITTHIEVSHRAQDLWLHQPIYRNYIIQHQDALQGGSPYPDVMYDNVCYRGTLHQIAEDTHWYPFMKVAIEYMRDRYPPPLQADNIQGQKFLAFLLGVASHQIADAVWHGSLTGCPNGFIDATAWESFNGDEQMAHSSVDSGGDSVIDYELPIAYIGLTNKWYVPSIELQELYKRYAIEYDSPLETNATAERVQVCSDLMFVGRFADALFLGIEYPKYSYNDTFLLDYLYEYYHGGLLNMAHQTVRYWDQIIAMYEKGTDICQIPSNNPYYLNCSISHSITYEQQQQSITYIRSKPSNYLPFSSHSSSSSPPTLQYNEIHTGVISNQSYASFGHTTLFGDFNNDNLIDLVISASDYYNLGCSQGGRVFIIYGKKDQPLIPEHNISIIEQIADQTLISPDCDGDRFGTGLAILDWNNDGFNDLVVSSPSHGYGYRGVVFIFAGSKDGLEIKPFLRIDGVNEHDAIGFELHTGHLDNDKLLDLIITSPYAQPHGYDQPQQGAVWIFLSSDFMNKQQISDRQLTINNASFTIYGEYPKSKFGYSLQIIPSSCMSHITSSPVILISAPANQGKLYFYAIESQPRLLFVMVNTENHAHFGQSFSVRNDKCWLAVSSPTQSNDWYGAVDIIPLMNIFNQQKLHLDLNDYPVLISIHGDRIFERLGTNIQWTPEGDLVISAPLGKGKILPLQLEKSEGFVYIVPGNRIPTRPDPKIHYISKMSSTIYVAQNRLNRFGTRMNVLSSESISYLVVSSPFTALYDDVRLPGMLYFQQLKQ
ncbi:unnamed protein product [Rotaria sp. Silwood2]|nr:unnamed protein product [Rotaria sp. Silwood2]CAF2740857.1 unnamed protein product [Rotaria sp. Silwood2]CAF3186160.1 unnamed protein product [Rotaria sp. Silwood2]CAF3929398.1 unnamed protein product [Rotaria sp. Silwood2]CAF4095262.1 unnamed protein product [Rotaria sp. Silwood2]